MAQPSTVGIFWLRLPDEDFQSLPSPSTRLRRSASNPLLEDPVTASPSRAKALLNVTKTGAEKIRKQKRALQKFAHQLRKESLEEEAPVIHLPLPPVTSLEKGGAKEGVADSFALRLLLIFDRLREAAAMRRNNLPESDAMSTLELMIFFLGSVQTQIQHMQVNLLEYS
ncbi:unnamed protein product [Effrenium voratum]|nr:unnamed protein product [Effrenium voratum]